jgi:hypothetical protein
MSDVRTESDRRARSGGVDVERDRVGIHNEAETLRQDRVRWGPVWAGVVTALGTYLFLQLALIATAIVDIDDSGTVDAIWSAGAAIVAFFLGGITAGASSMWQGADDGVLHGIIVWFSGLVAVIVLSALGSGLALGAFDTSDTFDDFSAGDIGESEGDDAEEVAANALLGLGLGLLAAAGGGAIGAKMWPRDDAFFEVTRVRDTRRRS